MATFNLAFYEKEVKDAYRDSIADEVLLNTLAQAIAYPVNELGIVDVSKSRASEIVNGKRHLQRELKKYTDDPRVTGSIIEYFQKNIVSKLHTEIIPELIHRINRCIRNDMQISDERKQIVARLANKTTCAEFLSNTFLLALIRPNQKITDVPESKIPELQSLPIPAEIDSIEINYVDALFQAYAQDSGQPEFTKSMLPKSKYERDFKDQRRYFFAAESIHRGVREIFGVGEPNQFDELKNEMLDGVIDTWDDTYKSGLDRKRKVMMQAVVVALDKCKLYRNTTWVDLSARKGICHFLIGENKLEGWVRDDDG